MKLYVTNSSPFAWMVRIVILEKGLENRVEILQAKTRTADSSYYSINPSGRVPYLICDDGTAMEESQLICTFLDHLDGSPTLDHPLGKNGWESRRLEALARSLLDGLCVWSRELNRPENDRSQTIIEHERQRSQRMFALWENEVQNPLMHDKLNMAQITFICALYMSQTTPGAQWQADNAKLTKWAQKVSQRSSIVKTLPSLQI